MRSWKLIEKRLRPFGLRALLLSATASAGAMLAAQPAAAQSTPRVLVIVDTSGSMLWEWTEDSDCWGDGSEDYPEQNCDGGSKMFHAKAALTDIVTSAGDVEFGLMRYSQLERGQAGFSDNPANYRGAEYRDADGDIVNINYDGSTPACTGADLLVSPGPNSRNAVLSWMDNVEDFPANKELRAHGWTPLTYSMDSATDEVRDQISSDDPADRECRPYFVLLLTDGYQQCPGGSANDPDVRAAVRQELVAQATALRNSQIGGLRYDVRTFVVGFGEGTEHADELDAMARAGGTAVDARGNIDLNNGTAYQANNPDALTLALQDAIAGAVPHELCDGRDNDCDGQVDEDWAALGRPCNVGAGACERVGVIVCNPDGSGTICSEIPGDPRAEECNLLDDDCDGIVDDGVQNACGECGPVPEEVCDGQDNDCDGAVDDGVLNACGNCGNPVEVCNGIDDDCDGQTDEGVLNACGACGEVPSEICNCLDDDCDRQIDDGLNNCPPCDCDPSAEVCDGEDNDCDGEIDDGVVNACGECGPEPEEVCDGVDDDCDGQVDESFPEAGQPCSTDIGECEVGAYVCEDGGLVCRGGADPQPEVCDGRDNDCDGEIDEGVYNACGYCGNLYQEVCDNIDNDCDAADDEGVLCRDEEACINGECAPPCTNGECYNNLVCVDDFCVTPCRNVDCPDGWVCDDGICSDPCADDQSIPCPDGTYCSLGACVSGDCYDPEHRCPDGQYCQGGACVGDPCADVECAPGQGCSAGVCFNDCRAMDCRQASAECADGGCICENGECKPDACARVACPYPQVCTEGVCGVDPCFEVDCGPGHICQAGACVEDPCNAITCPGQASPGADCHRGACTLEGDPAAGGENLTGADGGFGNGNSGIGSGDQRFLAGDGCACRSSQGPGGAFGLLLLGLVGIMRRRRNAA